MQYVKLRYQVKKEELKRWEKKNQDSFSEALEELVENIEDLRIYESDNIDNIDLIGETWIYRTNTDINKLKAELSQKIKESDFKDANFETLEIEN